jgi:ferric-dicitrate binding protein FerR (iron transport regulator)
MARIRAATEAAWRASLPQRASQRRWRAAVAVAVLVVSAASLYLWGPGRSDVGGEPVARLVHFESPGVVEERALGRDSVLAEGATLRNGQDYEVHGQSLIELTGGGSLRAAAGSEFEVLAEDDVRLVRGELYVDIPRGSHANASFVVRTIAGEFRHVGTQFALAVNRDETRLRVREGSVHWKAAGAESTVQAGIEIIINADTKTAERPISTSGNEWDWTTRTTPDFEIENRPLGEFLDWVARESGRKLVLADEQARVQAATIRMHGSVHGLTPLQALSAVMAATGLRFDLPDGQIRVSFAGDTTGQ